MDDYKKIEKQIFDLFEEKGRDAIPIIRNSIGVNSPLEHQKIINSVLSRIQKKENGSYFLAPYEKYELDFKPPLVDETMKRLRKGIGSLDEHEYYEKTEEFYNNMLLENIDDELHRLGSETNQNQTSYNEEDDEIIF